MTQQDGGHEPPDELTGDEAAAEHEDAASAGPETESDEAQADYSNAGGTDSAAGAAGAAGAGR